jgi:SET and MYND domain-containing protein
VSKDEELTIPYVDTRLGRRERRERLRKNFAFDCACERCAAEA